MQMDMVPKQRGRVSGKKEVQVTVAYGLYCFIMLYI